MEKKLLTFAALLLMFLTTSAQQVEPIQQPPTARPVEPAQEEDENEAVENQKEEPEKFKIKDYDMPRDADGKIYYSEVCNIADYKKDELFLKAQEWAVKTFVSAKQVIEVRDKEAGKIIAKAYTPEFHDNSFWKVLGTVASAMDHHGPTIDYTAEGSLWYVFSIDVKDGKYRIVADQFVSEKYGQDLKDTKKTRKWGKFKKFANDYILQLFSELKEFMLTKKDGDW